MSDTDTEATPVEDTEAVDISSTTPDEGVDVGDTPAPDEDAGEPDTFPRSYVEELRRENGKYRQRAQEFDSLANRLHTELVRATGKLADPTDLPFDAEHLDDPDKLTAAIEELLARKPHLAARRPAGDIGQGPSAPAAGVDLAAILRGQAG